MERMLPATPPHALNARVAVNAGALWGGGQYGGLVFGRSRSSKPPEDPSVAPVEAILNGAATQLAATAPSQGSRPIATHALWICACYTVEDAPTWLIYEDSDGGLMWCRVPDRVEASEVVDAQFSAGGHADPGAVLDWLQGKAPDPWVGGDGWDDDGVLGELLRKIRGS